MELPQNVIKYCENRFYIKKKLEISFQANVFSFIQADCRYGEFHLF